MNQLYIEKINNLDDFFGDCFGVIYSILEDDLGDEFKSELQYIKDYYIVDDIIEFISNNRNDIIQKMGLKSVQKREEALSLFVDLIQI